MAPDPSASPVRFANTPEDLPWDWTSNICQWQPLNSPHKIRLIKNIRQGIATELVGDHFVFLLETFCDFEILDLDDPQDVKYAALSYSWGNAFPEDYKGTSSDSDPEDSDDGEYSREYYIHCSGGKIPVTQNLMGFLNSSNKPESPIWIDAISINQNDIAERSSQVSMMDKIYAGAESVLVWLGPEDNASKTALRVIEKIYKIYDGIPLEQRPTGSFYFNERRLFSMIGTEPVKAVEWDAILLFFSRTWFRRIWMVQEVALSKRLHFFCGNRSITWGRLSSFVDWIHGLDWDVELKLHMRRRSVGGNMLGTILLAQVLDIASSIDQGPDGKDTTDLLRLLFGIEDSGKHSYGILGILIFRNQHRWATDLRDKVYGVLALAQRLQRNGPTMLPKSDYSKSTEEVYQEAAELIMRNSGSLGLLSLIDDRHNKILLNLPSWVPDFSQARGNEPLIMLAGHNACLGWSFKPPTILKAPSRLCSEAIQLDTIKMRTGLLADCIGVNHGLMECIEQTFLIGETYFNGQPTFEVLFRVLIQDCFERHWEKASSSNRQTIPYDQVSKSFQHWIKYHIASRSYELQSSTPLMEASGEIMQFLFASPLFPQGESIAPFYARFVELLQEDPELSLNEWDRDKWTKEIQDPMLLFEKMSSYSSQRSFMTTKRNFLGVAPVSALEGDQIWVLRGSRIPFVLRLLPNGNHKVIGEAYVHGFMRGELFTRDHQSHDSANVITLE